MNKTVKEAHGLVSDLITGLSVIENVESILCPPFTSLWQVKEMLDGTDIGLGAQNMYWEVQGAFTGEISPPMLAELCQFVIIGHSERRQFFGETDKTVNQKLLLALEFGLIPIICIGESLEENQAGLTADVLNRQIRNGLANLSTQEGENLVVAYEPIWAIGTGLTATPENANLIHKDVIRSVLEELFGNHVAQSIRILYGGSVKPDNASGFFSQSDIDGALVGGASLKSESFIAITKAASI